MEIENLLTQASNFYYEGFNLSLENSLNLQKISKLAADAGNFGIACSLNILAAEEAVKANFILLKHYNPNTEITNFKKIFRKHSTKHDHLKGIAAVHEIQLNRFKKDLEVFDKFLLIIDQLPENIKIETQEKFSAMYEIKNSVKKFEERKITYEEISTWADNANDHKNNGFYVDLRNDAWSSPNCVTEERYNQESKYTDAIIDYVRDTEKVFLDVKQFIEKT